MIGEVQYGGRVTDDYDKRLLNTFSKIWFLDTLFTENFEFYKGYPMLVYKQVSDYLKVIDEMSTVDPPQVYGLHHNADITYAYFFLEYTLLKYVFCYKRFMLLQISN